MKTIREDWPRVRQYVKAGNTYFSVDRTAGKPVLTVEGQEHLEEKEHRCEGGFRRE
jgi:hypothetical protein